MASSTKSGRVPAPNFLCCRVCNMWCWKIFKWLPVLLITSILAWSYYAYVIELCIKTIESTIEKTFNLIIYHFLLVMFVSSYWQTVFAEIPPIPDRFKLPEDELERLLSAESEEAQRLILENFAKDLPVYTRVLARVKLAIHMAGAQSENKKEILDRVGNKLNVLTRTASGSVRYCNRCMLVKPDRAHHCSICARCIPKMDHHCPWVNNCVCYHNYKFFILFLSYALMYCLFVMLTCLPYFIKFWKGEFGISNDPGRYHILFAFFVALMFAISLGSLLGYHIYLVMHNRTTLEAFRAPMFRAGQDKNGFSLGCYNNFKEVFGNKPNKWFIPVFTSSFGDGMVYPLPSQEEDTESLLSDGVDRWERWGDRARPFDERESSSCEEI